MTQANSSIEEPAWRCARTKTRSEHIAAAHLRQIEGVEVFCPRIRFRKSTRRGKVWFVEALFPGYVFVKFDLEKSLRHVSATPAVTTVVKFGEEIPSISAPIMEELIARLEGDEAEITVEDVMEPGDEVEVIEGPMRGMTAVVTRLMPAKDRVRILLEFLGSVCEVDVSQEDVLSQKKARNLAMH